MSKKTHQKRVERRNKVQRAQLKSRQDSIENGSLFRRKLGINNTIYKLMRRIYMEDELKAIASIWEIVGEMSAEKRSRILQFVANKHSEKAQLDAKAEAEKSASQPTPNRSVPRN